MSTLERVLLHAHAVDVGDGGERRGNSLPREGLQPCVAPYFATRGRGDMRGPPNSPPKATPEAVAGRHHTTQPCATPLTQKMIRVEP